MTDPREAAPPHNARAEFDTLARLDPEQHRHPDPYDPFLERLLPDHCARALEIGCGSGRFTRRLARHADEVIAIDISPEMLSLAKHASSDLTNVELREIDVLEWDWPNDQFDCVVCINTLHHLSHDAIEPMKRSLRPGGTLLIHDILHVSSRTPAGLAHNALALVVSRAHRLGHHRRQTNAAALRQFWRNHANRETYLSSNEVSTLANTRLPGAHIHTYLRWRYTITWNRPERATHSHQAPDTNRINASPTPLPMISGANAASNE